MDNTRKLITALLILSIMFSLASVVINISLSDTSQSSHESFVAGNQAGKIALIVESPTPENSNGLG